MFSVWPPSKLVRMASAGRRFRDLPFGALRFRVEGLGIHFFWWNLMRKVVKIIAQLRASNKNTFVLEKRGRVPSKKGPYLWQPSARLRV